MVLKNKKGVTTIMLIAVIFVSLALMIVLGVAIFGFTIVDESFSQLDFDVGNTSFNETYQQTLKLGITSMTTTFPTIISTGVLLGMVICLMFVGYNAKKLGKLWILFDIIFIIVAEVIAATVTSGFSTFINSNPDLLGIYSTTLSSGARFVLRLPIIIPVVGGLVMLATHLITKKKEEEEAVF